MQHPDTDLASGFVAELSDPQGRHLVLVAERLPRNARVRTARREQRRLASLLRRATRDEDSRPTSAAPSAGGWTVGEAPLAAPGHELCSAHFVSGAGWAWRVTAALVGEQRPAPVRRSASPRRPRNTPPCVLLP